MGIKTTKVTSNMHNGIPKEKAQTANRVFGWYEVVFDALYLCAALVIGILMLTRESRQVQVLAGAMALVLVGGDAFHLIPRMIVAVADDRQQFAKALGVGKLITSITMTVFYVLLWHVGTLLYPSAAAPACTVTVYALAALRIALCFMKQNRWLDEAPPVDWAVYRNIPFLLLGAAVAALFGAHAWEVAGLGFMWLAIALSFAFYMPVVLWANRNRGLGMLMLPKTCAYLWMLIMLAASLW